MNTLNFLTFPSDKDYCINLYCLNGGKCTNGASSFSCSCLNGYSGSFCQDESKLHFLFIITQTEKERNKDIILFAVEKKHIIYEYWVLILLFYAGRVLDWFQRQLLFRNDLSGLIGKESFLLKPTPLVLALFVWNVSLNLTASKSSVRKSLWNLMCLGVYFQNQHVFYAHSYLFLRLLRATPWKGAFEQTGNFSKGNQKIKDLFST